jgi:hypothetical protein
MHAVLYVLDFFGEGTHESCSTFYVEFLLVEGDSVAVEKALEELALITEKGIMTDDVDVLIEGLKSKGFEAYIPDTRSVSVYEYLGEEDCDDLRAKNKDHFIKLTEEDLVRYTVK